MSSNVELIKNLFSALNAHDHDAMAKCYHKEAHFHDIAFDLRGIKRIHAMWDLICDTDIQVTVSEPVFDESTGQAVITDVYTFSDTCRKVTNNITSKFRFRDDLIVEHHDDCEPLEWARQAYGGIKGEIIGRLGFLRRIGANKKIRRMLAAHPQYRETSCRDEASN